MRLSTLLFTSLVVSRQAESKKDSVSKRNVNYVAYGAEKLSNVYSQYLMETDCGAQCWKSNKLDTTKRRGVFQGVENYLHICAAKVCEPLVILTHELSQVFRSVQLTVRQTVCI